VHIAFIRQRHSADAERVFPTVNPPT
jgi:hypothetical protein